MSYAMFNAKPAEGNHERMVKEIGALITPIALRSRDGETFGDWITLIPPGALRRHMNKKPTGIEFIEAKEVDLEPGLLDLRKLHTQMWSLKNIGIAQHKGESLMHISLNVFGMKHSLFADVNGPENGLNTNSIGVILYLATYKIAENIVGPIALTWFDTREREIKHGHY